MAGSHRACRGCGWRLSTWRGFCRICAQERGLIADQFDLERQRAELAREVRRAALAERDRRESEWRARRETLVLRTVVDEGKEFVVTWDGTI